MASAVPMSRSRGSLSGLALLLLGAWGGLAPFVGPYFHFGFQPDKAWSYDAGRLYLVIVPGAVVLLCGLIVMATKSRWLAGVSGIIAALGGLWFVLGRTTMLFIGTSTAPYVRSLLNPIAHSPRGAILTEVVFFTGLGALIVFSGALASGRVSIGAYRDFVRFGDATAGAAAGAVGGGLASVGLSTSPSYGSASPSYTPYQPTNVSPFPPAEDPTVGGQVKFPTQYPTTGGETVASSGASANPFTPGQVTYSPGQTRYPPAQEPQTNPLTAPTQEQKSPPGQ
jgi:hypothetical protein